MIYNILCDGISIYNPSPSSAIINPKLELSVNEPGTLTFTMMPDHASYDTIRAFTSNIEVYEGEELIFFGRILDIKTNFLKQKEVTCEGALGYLYDTVQYPVSFVPSEDHSTEQTTIHQFFTYLITEHNKLVTSDDRKFKIGTVNLTDADISRELAYDKTMDCVKQMCIDAFGGYLFVRKEDDGNYIDWLRDFSGVSAQPIQYAMNLTDLSQDFKGSDMVTSIVPIGDNGLDVSGKDDQQQYINKRNPGKAYIDSDAVATYGRVLEKVDFDGITDPEVLYEYGLKWLTDKQFDALSTDVTSADLSYFNPDYGVYKIGQSVHITSNPHLIDTNLPIQKISYNLDSPIKSITIGTPPRKSLTDMYSGGGGSGSSSSATEKSTINRIASSVVDEKVPGMVGNLVQYIPHLEGGYKIGALSIDETVHDLYSNLLYGEGDPSSSLGSNENVYISYSEPHTRIKYIRTNYSNFGLELTNWHYKLNDKFELIYKNEDNPNKNGYWPAFLVAYNSDDSVVLGMSYNMFARRQCLNIRYTTNYTGDGNIQYNSPYDYTNYFKIVGNGAKFYMYKGASLDNINTTEFSLETWTTETGQATGPVKLFCATGSTSMDATLYSLKVWNSDGDLIHDYEPIEDGLVDLVDDIEFVTSTTGHINGPVIHTGGFATGIWHKEEGEWVKEELADPDVVEAIDISWEDYQLLTPEEKEDPSKVYYVHDTPGGGGGGTYVEANPQETPTDSLETIKIGNVVYDIPGGGGGDSYNRTSLWSGTQGTAGQITLNDDIGNYDALEFITKLSNGAHNTVVVDAKSFTTDYPYTSSVSASIPHYCLLGYDNCFARVITGSTSSSLYAWDFLYLYLAEVNGIKYGGSGSGGGESYKETIIYEASASADTYHLTSPLSNFDAIVCYAKYSGSVQGNFMVSSMFLVDKIETGVNYGICSDDWYTYFSKTDDSNLARSNQDKAFLYKIIGINFGGNSGNEEGKCDSLYKAQSTTPPNTITLSESITDYDFLVTHIKSSVSGKATIGYTYTVDALSTGDIIGGELAAGNGWIWYTYTDSTTLTYLGVAQNYYIEEITGVKIGSGSGKVSKIKTGEVLDITAGDGTTSRTFTLSKTPKFVSMSWAADSSWKYNGSFAWGSDRLYFSALDSSPALSGAYLGVSTITYGQDGKSFTITGGNAGGCANTSATTGKLYVDYGEGIGKADVQPSSNYSTTEQVIGTWIDGKPLYQKTVVINNPSTASNISISDLSYDSCFVFDGYLSISGGSNLALNEDERSWVHIYDNKIVWEYSSNYTGLKLVITIRYTKTTDVPGSGSYAELGAPAVHYDTSEHVIGTYFGKPLYRKGFEFATLTFSSQSVSVNNDLANIEDVVNYGGSFYEPRDGRNIPLPFTRKIYNEHVNIQAMVLNSDHTVDLQLVTNSDWYQTIQNVKIWLEYTKTTDT